MLGDVVNKLLHLEAELVVTIKAPLDRRRPGNEEDRIRLRNLLADARTRVLARWDRGRAHSILGWLDEAAANVELGGGAHGVVIVATSDMGVAQLLPFPVREAIALGSTPATRFLVQGLRRSPRYRLIVVSDRATRLFEAVRVPAGRSISGAVDRGPISSPGIAARTAGCRRGGSSRAPSRCRCEPWHGTRGRRLARSLWSTTAKRPRRSSRTARGR